MNRLEKKYQFFISSTYEDLKEERNKAIQAILTMNQFPIGMEMFSNRLKDKSLMFFGATGLIGSFLVDVIANWYAPE